MTTKPYLLPDPYVFPAYPSDLPERDAGDNGGPSYVVTAVLEEERDSGVTLSGRTQQGDPVTITVTVVAPGVVHVLLEGQGAASERITLARRQIDRVLSVAVEKAAEHLVITSDEICIHIDLDPFGMLYTGADGRRLLAQNSTHRDATDRITMLPFGFSVVNGQRAAFHDTFTAEPDEHFYGFGEKFTDFDKRGQMLEMWAHNTYGVHTERAYKPVPFFVSTRGYGIFVDSVTATRFDMAASNHAVFSMIVPDSALDYYVIAGPDPKTIITRYAELVSFPVMPPKWAFGLWMSGGFQAETPESLLKRARQMREYEIPCDVLHIDPYWQRFGAWSDMQWDREAFPDPEGLIAQLKDQHFKISVWENPYLGIESDFFEEASQKGYLLKMPGGETYVLDLLDGYCPPMGIIDFTNPEAVKWFKEVHRPLLRMGIDIFKTDFGESVPADAIAHNGMTGETLHNLYPLLYNDAVTGVIQEETGRPGLVWARSSFAGGQRHVAQWGADCDCTYQGMTSTIRGGLSIGMCGHAFWGHDIGGFYVEPTPELYIRWAEFGMLSPLSRAHGVTSRVPWDYGEDAVRIFREYTRLRYRLVPYLYSLARVAVDTSLPIMRPMLLEFPDDPCTYAVDLQYMLGPNLLVAPIYNSEGRRPVYFPQGTWIDFWTHELIEGPCTRFVEAPLDVMPLYVRDNALIPTIDPPQYLTDAPFDLVTFDAYLLGTGSFTLYDTDGITEITASLTGTRLDVQFEGVKQQAAVRLIPLAGVPAIEQVRVNSAVLQQRQALDIKAGASAGWARMPDGEVQIMIRKA